MHHKGGSMFFYRSIGFLFSSGLLVLAPTLSHALDLGPVNINGFVSQGYLNSAGNNFLSKSIDGTTQYNEIALTVSSQVTDKFRLGMQLLSRDLGSTGNNEVRLDWGFGDYHFNDLVGIRAGKVKLPMGLYNEGRDSDFMRPMVFLPQSVYDENKRDLLVAYKGVGLYGNVPVGSAGDLDYHVYAGSIDYFSDSGQAKGVRQQMQSMAQKSGRTLSGNEFNNRYVYGGSVIYNTPLDGLRFGGSVFNGKTDFDISLTTYAANSSGAIVPTVTAYKGYGNMKNNVVASVEYASPYFTIASEYIQFKAIKEFGFATPAPSGISDGWYVLLSVPVNQFTFSGLYDVFYEDRNDRHGDRLGAQGMKNYQAWRKDLGLALRYDFNSNWAIKTEYHYLDGAAIGTAAHNTGVVRYWNYFAAKVSFNF